MYAVSYRFLEGCVCQLETSKDGCFSCRVLQCTCTVQDPQRRTAACGIEEANEENVLYDSHPSG